MQSQLNGFAFLLPGFCYRPAGGKSIVIFAREDFERKVSGCEVFGFEALDDV